MHNLPAIGLTVIVALAITGIIMHIFPTRPRLTYDDLFLPQKVRRYSRQRRVRAG